MTFEPGDTVVICSGEWKGTTGKIKEYMFERYMVEFEPGKYVACREEELAKVFYEPVPDEEPEEVKEVPVYDFGISTELLAKHLEWLVGNSLQKVGSVGPEQAFFGFQEFEGKSPQEVLLEIMEKLEEGVAMFAQAHVLVGRIVMALETMDDQK